MAGQWFLIFSSGHPLRIFSGHSGQMGQTCMVKRFCSLNGGPVFPGRRLPGPPGRAPYLFRPRRVSRWRHLQSPGSVYKDRSPGPAHDSPRIVPEPARVTCHSTIGIIVSPSASRPWIRTLRLWSSQVPLWVVTAIRYIAVHASLRGLTG
jgi:hypothetical protein